MSEIIMQEGKIYHLSYGGNTQIVGRYKQSGACDHHFYDLLHYWNGFETFRQGGQPCLKSGIDSIRRASKSEIHALIRHEIENDCI